MRQSIGGLWIMSLIIVFMSIFIAYIAITINYNRAYKLKTSVVTVMEEYEGMNNTALSKITALISSYGYTQKGACDKTSENSNLSSTYYGLTVDSSSDGFTLTKNPTTKQNICIYREYKKATNGGEAKYYYTVDVFFGFTLPVVGDLFDFRVSGETGAIYYPNDPNKWE